MYAKTPTRFAIPPMGLAEQIGVHQRAIDTLKRRQLAQAEAAAKADVFGNNVDWEIGSTIIVVKTFTMRMVAPEYTYVARKINPVSWTITGLIGSRGMVSFAQMVTELTRDAASLTVSVVDTVVDL